MFDFIRAEYLNLIIDRKKFVKDEKERLKAERSKSPSKIKQQSSGSKDLVATKNHNNIETPDD